jgi:hypothetical protein
MENTNISGSVLSKVEDPATIIKNGKSSLNDIWYVNSDHTNQRLFIKIMYDNIRFKHSRCLNKETGKMEPCEIPVKTKDIKDTIVIIGTVNNKKSQFVIGHVRLDKSVDVWSRPDGRTRAFGRARKALNACLSTGVGYKYYVFTTLPYEGITLTENIRCSDHIENILCGFSNAFKRRIYSELGWMDESLSGLSVKLPTVKKRKKQV